MKCSVISEIAVDQFLFISMELKLNLEKNYYYYSRSISFILNCALKTSEDQALAGIVSQLIFGSEVRIFTV